MVQGAPQSAGRFEDEIRMWKAPPPEVSSEAFYETDPTKDYKRGYSIQNVSPLPITYAEHVTAQGHWGEALAPPNRATTCTGRPSARSASFCRATTTRSRSTTRRQGSLRAGRGQFSYTQCDNDKNSSGLRPPPWTRY